MGRRRGKPGSDRQPEASMRDKPANYYLELMGFRGPQEAYRLIKQWVSDLSEVVSRLMLKMLRRTFRLMGRSVTE
jgi:hypothetical protein